MNKFTPLLLVLSLIAVSCFASVFPIKADPKTVTPAGEEFLSSSSPPSSPSNSTDQSTPTPTLEPRQALPSAFIIAAGILAFVAVFYAAFSLSLREISKRKIRKNQELKKNPVK